MDLSNNLISQFVKITNDNTKKQVNETIVYGTVVEENSVKYVKIDGSDLLTPVSTTANMVDGERVTVMIKNHLATVTGNITSPSASSTELVDMEGVIGKVEDNVSDLVNGNFATRSELDSAVEGINNNLSTNYMTAVQVDTAISNAASDLVYDINTTYATNAALSSLQNVIETNYATNSSVSEEISKCVGEINETYATKESVDNLSTDLSTNYSTTSDIQNTYATKESVDNLSTDLSTNYSTTSDIQNTYATKESVEAITHPMWTSDISVNLDGDNSIEDILLDKPINMNGYSLTLNLEADYIGDISIDSLINGKVIFNMNEYTIDGSVYCYGKNMVYHMVGPGKIKPEHETTTEIMSTVEFEECEYVIEEIDLYSDGENTNCVAINTIASKGDVYNVKIFGQGTFKHFIQAINKSHLYLDSSSGSCNDVIIIASKGSIVAINEDESHCGTSGSTSIESTKGSLIIQNDITFDNTANID